MPLNPAVRRMRQENLRPKASLGYREKHRLDTTTTNKQKPEMHPHHLFWQCRSAVAVFLESGDPTAHAPQLDSVLPTANFHPPLFKCPPITQHT